MLSDLPVLQHQSQHLVSGGDGGPDAAAAALQQVRVSTSPEQVCSFQKDLLVFMFECFLLQVEQRSEARADVCRSVPARRRGRGSSGPDLLGGSDHPHCEEHHSVRYAHVHAPSPDSNTGDARRCSTAAAAVVLFGPARQQKPSCGSFLTFICQLVC